mmetsp:Transcript_50581/g.96588  ORF Transcript_50581/g.96588 Transcript_50581/m.96588 type:complete len:378 (-) Transcript_50581:470-1603(-)
MALKSVGIKSVCSGMFTCLAGCACGKRAGANLVFGNHPMPRGDASLFVDNNEMLQSMMATKKLSPADDDTDFEQTGGHAQSFKAQGKVVLKEATSCEADFYLEASKAAEALDNEGGWPIQFMPAFYGVEERSGVKYIKMENLLAGHKNPCIMDLKLGTVTVETKASIVKQSKLRVRDLLVGARFEGVQLVAMSVYRSSIKAQMKSSKLASQIFTSVFNIEQILGFFLSDEGLKINHDLVRRYLVQLKAIRDAMKLNKRFGFTGSSLLFIHSGTGLKSARKPEIKMIDFAHVTTHTPEKGQVDKGYLAGLDTLISGLELLQDAKRIHKVDIEGGMETAYMAMRWKKETEKMRAGRLLSLRNGNRKASPGITHSVPVDI